VKETDRLEAILGGLELKNGVLVPIDWSGATYANAPPLPPVTVDYVRLTALEFENQRLREACARLATERADLLNRELALRNENLALSEKLREALTRNSEIDAATGCDAAGESDGH
jgi:hypothetical protein